jgi:hypothetical protein
MPPVPMYPNNPMPCTDGHHRWWMWNGHEINLNADDLDEPPVPVRAAILAHRDAVSPEDLDFAFYLVWLVDEHPPWDRNCPTCHTAGPCTDQLLAHGIALQFLIRKSTEIVRRSQANLARRDWKRATA